MVIHRAVQFVKPLLADAGEDTESIASEILCQLDCSGHIVISDFFWRRLFDFAGPSSHSQKQTETDDVDFKFAEETDHSVVHLVVAHLSIPVLPFVQQLFRSRGEPQNYGYRLTVIIESALH